MSYICKEVGERQPIVSCKYPNQARDRGKDVEQGEEDDDGDERNQHISGNFRAGDAVYDPKNW